MAREFLGVGWKFPISLDGRGAIEMSEHESRIQESVQLVLETAPGERLMRPDFGCRIHELIHAPNAASVRALAENHCRDALARWEPRIDVLEVRSTVEPGMPNVMSIVVQYEVRTTNNQFNLVFPFYLDQGVGS